LTLPEAKNSPRSPSKIQSGSRIIPARQNKNIFPVAGINGGERGIIKASGRIL